MKVKTNVKAGGLLCVDIDANVDVDVNIGGGCKDGHDSCK
jgi:hypothetical protein